MNVMDKDLILIVGGALVVAVVLHGMWLTWRARRDRLPVELATDVPKTDHEDGDILGPPRVVASGTEQGTLRLWNPADDALARAPVAQAALAASTANVGPPVPAYMPTEPPAAPIFSREEAMAPAPTDAWPVVPIVPDDSVPSLAVGGAVGGAVGLDAVAAVRAPTDERPAGLENGAHAVADVEPDPAAGREEEVRVMGSALGAAEAVPAVAAAAVGGIGAVPLGVEVSPRVPVEADGGVGPTEPAAEPPSVGSDGIRGADDHAQSSRGGGGARGGGGEGGGGREDSAAEEGTSAWRSKSRAAEVVDRQDEEIFVINVLARNGETFNGADLFEAFMRNALKFRDMNIFHRLDPVSGAVRFSVSNAVEPGIFDLSDMASLETPGVTLFFRLPGPEQPGEVLDDMLGVARDIGKSLGGDLKDENMSVLTGQTLSHFKQRMAEFSRKRMSMRARHG